ncbi:Uncharacterised protein [Serratia ficaria]|uniref:Uncharacterized protein n=1 Tax=Serratia ficaria TaxID=61651 RepID=A0A240BG24_SERFI|nr:hypothetical protein C7332_4436 [Serratia ficaria]CAI0858726.1 Uncharacterised protein [Serratia ficaria]CAI0934857.1 Uncharacterised protein [Serratia ficaria]CAI0948318.1 Uncharacterised protein [Serratia ficaria]CAI1010194.1 Uncharacterised protein [Serratia ficaria]
MIWGITTDEFWNGLRAVSVFDDDTAEAQCGQTAVGFEAFWRSNRQKCEF